MTGTLRGPGRRTAVVILIAGLLAPCAGLLPGATAARTATAPGGAPNRPALKPVSLHALVGLVGAEVGWVEPNKKLRVKNARCEMIFEADRREFSVDGIRVFLGEAPQLAVGTLMISPVDRDLLLLPLLAPPASARRSPVRTIMLDAGHGGKDNGARNEALKLLEKDLALDVVRRLQHQLEMRGYRVLLTRSDDTFIDLGERPKLAAKAGADLFLAVHFNAGPPTVTGIETYRLTPQYQRSTASEKLAPDDDSAVPGNAWDAWNTLLSFSIHRQLQLDVGRFDRGLKHARFVVIRDLATCPGVLIECGYLSNAGEAKLSGLPAHREQLAAAIATGVDRCTVLLNPPPAAVPAPPPANNSRGAIRAPRLPATQPVAPR